METYAKVPVFQTNDSNVDLYLPLNHPYDYIYQPLTLAGYTHGACRLLLIGRMCSSVPHNQIIHHYIIIIIILLSLLSKQIIGTST